MDWQIKPLDSAGVTRSSLKKYKFESGQSDLDQYLKQLKNIIKTGDLFP
ncbi:hypothetical protein [Spirulina sp. 06S082]|nr:hypothetical protein [Spirulina sp. 06S082]MEA5468189.1 hypothetical protein [Spirulina sp. 06S082]